VLEQIFGRRRYAALKDEARFDEAAESLLQFGLGERRGTVAVAGTASWE